VSAIDVLIKSPIMAESTEGAATVPARVLAVGSVLPALLGTGWLLAAVPLAMTGLFHPWLVFPLAGLAAVVVAVPGTALVRRVGVIGPAPWWPVVLTFAIAVGFAVFAALTHSEQVVLRRDAGSYVQIGYLLAHAFGLHQPVPGADFGPLPAGATFASPAFYQIGGTIVPQFMSGWPTVLGGADWLGGWTGMLIAPALVGGATILAIGGLAGRVLGARWAPVAAFLTAFAWPVLRVSQVTLSEPLGALLLAGGICLAVDLVTAPVTASALLRRHAFAAGLVLAGGELVRLDFGVDFALLLPVLGWCWLRRRPGRWSFWAGAVLSGGLAVVDGAVATRPYVSGNRQSVVLMLLLLAVVAVLTAVAAGLLRRLGRGPTVLRWWRPVPVLGAGMVALVGVGLVLRPFVSVDHSNTDPGVIAFTASVQHSLGLPVDGTRAYAEHSLQWVSWYLGWPLLAAALVAAVALTRSAASGRDRAWWPVLTVYLGSAVLVLVRPAITPDHPWADRRLVTEVIPALVLLATWTAAKALARTRGRWRITTGLVFAVAFLIPMAVATVPMAPDRTELGELAAARQVCASLRPTDSVVLLDGQWLPTIREQCSVPVVLLQNPSVSAMSSLEHAIRARGRTPVIAGSQMTDPRTFGVASAPSVVLDTRTDQSELLRRPYATDPLRLEFWLSRP
jgi:hypothetical protein